MLHGLFLQCHVTAAIIAAAMAATGVVAVATVVTFVTTDAGAGVKLM